MHKGHIKLCFESLALLFIFSFTRLKRKKHTKFFFPLWFLTIFPSGILSFQAEAKILRGPHEDLESYLEAIDQLRSNVNFFSSNKNFKSSDGFLNHANQLLTKAISKLEEEFRHLLTNYRFFFWAFKFVLFWRTFFELKFDTFTISLLHTNTD